MGRDVARKPTARPDAICTIWLVVRKSVIDANDVYADKKAPVSVTEPGRELSINNFASGGLGALNEALSLPVLEPPTNRSFALLPPVTEPVLRRNFVPES